MHSLYLSHGDGHSGTNQSNLINYLMFERKRKNEIFSLPTLCHWPSHRSIKITNFILSSSKLLVAGLVFHIILALFYPPGSKKIHKTKQNLLYFRAVCPVCPPLVAKNTQQRDAEIPLGATQVLLRNLQRTAFFFQQLQSSLGKNPPLSLSDI